MPYSYLDHAADVGIMAKGTSIHDAFESGAEALLNIMYDLESIECTRELPVTGEAEDIALLFVEVLNEILSLQDIEGIALKKLTAEEIGEHDGIYRFTGVAGGEPFDVEKHTVRTEAKAATYAGLDYTVINGEHVLQCIIDV
ncbi:MAG: archease [Deltaproteobacteria bacterium]|nr:archease [Deltaproteobacteria bacterium]